MIIRLVRLVTLVVGLWAAAGTPGSAAVHDRPQTAQAAGPKVTREYLIKAALLYNFAKFTDWPAHSFEGPDAPLLICVLGADPFGPALKTIEGKVIKNRPVVTRVVSRVLDSRRCHVIFVSDSEQSRLAEILELVGDDPILTIADMPDFAVSGGIINLKVVENKSRFDINLAAAHRANLKLSSKLLILAQQVMAD